MRLSGLRGLTAIVGSFCFCCGNLGSGPGGFCPEGAGRNALRRFTRLSTSRVKLEGVAKTNVVTATVRSNASAMASKPRAVGETMRLTFTPPNKFQASVPAQMEKTDLGGVTSKVL